jgi:importin-5
MDALSDVLNACLREYGEAVMPLVDTLMPSVWAWATERGRSHEEKRIAICILDDIVEHASKQGASHK